MLKYNSWALLPAGKINLKTGETTHFNLIENNGSNIGSIVLLKRNGTKFVACSTCGSFDSFLVKHPVGSYVLTHHDQTRKMNYSDVIVGYFSSTMDQLQEIKNIVGKNLISFSVFK